MAYQWFLDEPKKIPFAIKNNAGGDATVQEGSLSVVSNNPEVVTLALDGGFIVATNVGIGKWTAKIVGDADLGDGVTEISAPFEGEIQSRQADRIELGEAVAQ